MQLSWRLVVKLTCHSPSPQTLLHGVHSDTDQEYTGQGCVLHS